MKIVCLAFEFQLKTNENQQAKMRNFAGSCCFIWNKTLAGQLASYSKVAAELVNWKQQEETQFLKEIHSQILQQKLMDLDQALQEALDKTTPKQFPRFKKKGLSIDSFRYQQGFKIDEPKKEETRLAQNK